MAQIALFSCPSEDFLTMLELGERKRFPHIGLMYLATYLQEVGHEAKIFDLWQKGIRWQHLTEELDRLDPQLIGFNVHTESYDVSLDLSKRLKARYPEAKIVWGGAFPSFAYPELLQNEVIDYIVRFEGEIVITNLVKHVLDPASFPVEDIASMAYRQNGAVVANPIEKPLRDLNSLPFIDRSLVCFDDYVFPSISSSRGCPSDCTFCASRAFWGKRVRFRSAENIFQEVLSLYEKYGLLEFVIVDDTFTAYPPRTIEFCKKLLETGIPFRWFCESRVDVASRELLEIMHRAGCGEIQFGIESGCQEILTKLRKGITVEQIENAFSLAQEFDYTTIGSFILGHPWDTVDTMKRTIEFIYNLRQKNNVDTVYGSPNTPFPGCWQYEHADELGLKIHAKSWSEFRLNNPIVSAPGFTLDQLRELYFYSHELFNAGSF
jgi:radical SAM superfamily enzyme YgiQ (UPF0313 family)